MWQKVLYMQDSKKVKGFNNDNNNTKNMVIHKKSIKI